ncbi:MAG: carbohydrate binding domain-containing protein, partial [Acidobacteriota bacterium]
MRNHVFNSHPQSLNNGQGQGQNFTDVNALADPSKAGVWQRVSGTFTTAAATTGVKIRGVHDGGQSGMSAVFYADEISITPGTTPPATAWTYDYRAGDSRVDNSGFETGTSTNANAWYQYYAQRSSAVVHSGGYSMRLSSSGTAYIRSEGYARVRGDTRYRLSGWVHISSYSGGNIYLDLNDGQGEGQNFTDANIQANTAQIGSWQYVSGTFDTAAGTTGVKVRVVKDGSGGITAYVDDLELREESADLGTPQNGMISEIRDQVNPSYSEDYGYDNLYRLVHADTSVWTAEWTYDRYGNRLSQTTTGVSYSETLSINSTSNRVSGWTYDAAGNVTNDGNHT